VKNWTPFFMERRYVAVASFAMASGSGTLGSKTVPEDDRRLAFSTKTAAAMAKAIPKEDRDQYCSMINFDSFGFAYPQVMTNTTTRKMAKFADDLAKEIQMPFHEGPIGGADADSSSFVNKDIPAITFHGLSNKWPEYLHTSKDKIENVKPESVLMGYNFGLLFVSRFDPGPCGMFRK